jgi:hypothetical protein
LPQAAIAQLQEELESVQLMLAAKQEAEAMLKDEVVRLQEAVKEAASQVYFPLIRCL